VGCQNSVATELDVHAAGLGRHRDRGTPWLVPQFRPDASTDDDCLEQDVAMGLSPGRSCSISAESPKRCPLALTVAPADSPRTDRTNKT
jgi:hypothetical protein